MTLGTNDIQLNNTLPCKLNVIMLYFPFYLMSCWVSLCWVSEYNFAECSYAECHYVECHFAECSYAECHHADCHYAECHHADCHHAECHYAECHYAECRGAPRASTIKNFRLKLILHPNKLECSSLPVTSTLVLYLLARLIVESRVKLEKNNIIILI